MLSRGYAALNRISDNFGRGNRAFHLLAERGAPVRYYKGRYGLNLWDQIYCYLPMMKGSREITNSPSDGWINC